MRDGELGAKPPHLLGWLSVIFDDIKVVVVVIVFEEFRLRGVPAHWQRLQWSFLKLLIIVLSPPRSNRIIISSSCLQLLWKKGQELLWGMSWLEIWGIMGGTPEVVCIGRRLISDQSRFYWQEFMRVIINLFLLTRCWRIKYAAIDRLSFCCDSRTLLIINNYWTCIELSWSTFHRRISCFTFSHTLAWNLRNLEKILNYWLPFLFARILIFLILFPQILYQVL